MIYECCVVIADGCWGVKQYRQQVLLNVPHAELAAGIGCLVALDIPCSFKFINSGADGIFALPIDVRKARQGVIPVIW